MRKCQVRGRYQVIVKLLYLGIGPLFYDSIIQRMIKGLFQGEKKRKQ